MAHNKKVLGSNPAAGLAFSVEGCMFSSFPSTVQRHAHQGTGDIKAAVDVNDWLSLPYDRLVTCPECTKEVGR